MPYENDLRLAILLVLRASQNSEEPITSFRLRDKLKELFEVDDDSFGSIVGDTKKVLRPELIEYGLSSHDLTDRGAQALLEIDKFVEAMATANENEHQRAPREPIYKTIEALDSSSFDDQVAASQENGGRFLTETFQFGIHDGKRFYAGVVEFPPPPTPAAEEFL
ncbi:MAG: hypothetical protein OXK78_14815 [Caldilineaceae bacterium]|nr:hypothetical protein [Caldilineaceae bacterium]